MERIKEILAIVFGGRIVVEGNGRTFAKAPAWLVVLAAIASIRLAIITALLIVAFGMRARVVKK